MAKSTIPRNLCEQKCSVRRFRRWNGLGARKHISASSFIISDIFGITVNCNILQLMAVVPMSCG